MAQSEQHLRLRPEQEEVLHSLSGGRAVSCSCSCGCSCVEDAKKEYVSKALRFNAFLHGAFGGLLHGAARELFLEDDKAVITDETPMKYKDAIGLLPAQEAILEKLHGEARLQAWAEMLYVEWLRRDPCSMEASYSARRAVPPSAPEC